MRRDSVGKMKTLDAVIKALEYCLNPVDNFGNCNAECPYIHCCDPSNRDVTEDALHYLRVLQKMQKAKPLAKSEWEELYNPPLTWDELRTMEGKPIWVESSGPFNRRRWMFVGEWFDDDEMRLFDMGYDYPDYVSKNSYESGTWQAYRKERDER